MLKCVSILSIALSLLFIGCGQESSTKTDQTTDAQLKEPAHYDPDDGARLDASSPTGFYIPQNLDEAIYELGRVLGPEQRDQVMALEEGGMANYHMGLGLWIRNEWGLWSGSRLAKYFIEIGIYHPDDMSGIILESYWRDQHDVPIDLASQIAGYQEYWAEQPTPLTHEEITTRVLTPPPRSGPVPLPYEPTPPPTVEEYNPQFER